MNKTSYPRGDVLAHCFCYLLLRGKKYGQLNLASVSATKQPQPFVYKQDRPSQLHYYFALNFYKFQIWTFPLLQLFHKQTLFVVVVAVAGEKCGSCTFAKRKRRNSEDNKPLVRVPTVEPRFKPWMLRSSPSSVSYPSVSRSRESTSVPTAPDVQSCITEPKPNPHSHKQQLLVNIHI